MKDALPPRTSKADGSRLRSSLAGSLTGYRRALLNEAAALASRAETIGTAGALKAKGDTIID